MKYSSLFALPFVLLATPTLAIDSEQLTVYGKLNLAVQINDENDDSTTELESHYSRFGIKGKQAINADWTAVYLLEWQVNIDDDSDDALKGRNQYLGLQGPIGEVLLGRKDSAFKSSQGKVDRFGDINGDLAGFFASDDRVDESVHYKSPKWGDAQLSATYVLEGNAKQGNAADDGASKTAYSLAVSYGGSKWKNGEWFASAAYNSEMLGITSYRATVYGQYENIQLGAMVQRSESDKASDSDDKDGNGYLLNAAYKMNQWVLKTQYQNADMALGNKQSEGDVLSVGADYHFNKATSAYIFSSAFDLDRKEYDENYHGVGLIHLF
ncbi:porin [Echinimonas agarilytica]|uniref:Porin n=1 Tax=Echinimonas agarilytica TaxID=1215918 RepID=A0AA41W862_9GAMM|nr:porin [Echinimonas agarilytica]MCM2680181.1 porin [Echinimonas agarilytica]